MPLVLVFVALEAIAGQQTRKTLHLCNSIENSLATDKPATSDHLRGYLLASYHLLVDVVGRRYDAPWNFCCRTCSYTSPPAAGAALPRLATGGICFYRLIESFQRIDFILTKSFSSVDDYVKNQKYDKSKIDVVHLQKRPSASFMARNFSAASCQRFRGSFIGSASSGT